jgi:CHASE2 domain-containing sensor protein
MHRAIVHLSHFAKKHQSTLIASLITGLVALGLVGIRRLGIMAPMELLTYDYLMRMRPAEPVDDRILIVEINESDIQRIGKWPWTDQLFADLIRNINSAQPAVIAIDKYLDIPVIDQARNGLLPQVRQLLKGQIPDPLLNRVLDLIKDRGRDNLIQSIKQAGNVVNISFVPIKEGETGVTVPPDLAEISYQGFANIPTDTGAIVRRALIAGDSASFALTTANLYLSKLHNQAITFDPETVTFRAGQQVIPRFSPYTGGYHQEDSSGYQILINYRGKEGTFRRLSAADILQGKPLDKSLLKDKIVLIGVTAVSLKDSFATPFSTGEGVMYGVEVHANIISQLVSSTLQQRPAITAWDEGSEAIWIIGLTLWGGLVAIVVGKVGLNLALLAGSVAGSTAIGWALFNQAVWIPLLPATIGLVGANLAVIAYRLAVQESERKLLMGLFSRHVSKELVDVIWENRDQFISSGRIAGQDVYVTVLFTDMRNFSSAAEAQQPGETLNWLNSYLSTIADEVIKHGGMVDKYIGDAVMAVFGVPIPHTHEDDRNRDAQNAVRAAIAIAQKLEQMNEVWLEQGLPDVSTGIGINSGMVIAGSLGSAERLEYSVLGDAVNIAARLESFNKEVDGGEYHILISDETKVRLGDSFRTEFVGSYALKGKVQETAVYRVPPQPLPTEPK